MATAIHPHNHPFRFLLYLEWILLAIPTGIELLPRQMQFTPSSSLVVMTGMGLFTLMGLYVPTHRLTYKIFYTGLEFGLILVLTLIGNIRLYPLIFIPVMLRSCLMFRLPGQLFLCGITLICFVVITFNRIEQLTLQPLELIQQRVGLWVLMMAILFSISITFLVLLLQSLLSERHSRDQLAQANAQLREYALQIESLATLQERNRIAREIHDSLGHSLTALNIQLEGALKLWRVKPDQARTFLQEAKQLGSTALQDVRHSVSALRSDPLRGESLPDAIGSLVKNFQSVSGITPDLTLHPDPFPLLSFESRSSIYRIIQESLTNIFKYAEATQVQIRIIAHAEHLSLEVMDNGKGFQVGSNTTGFGLQGMRERTLALKGIFHLDSQPGAGCHIQVQIPIYKTQPGL